MADIAGHVTVVADQTYDVRGRSTLRADLYLPRNPLCAPPVIVWVHGGGWRYGSRRVAPDLTRFFAARDFAMVAVDYRLSDCATFPAQIEDLRTAIRWIRSVAGQYGFDAGRIGLWGVSAGGHLSSLAALCPKGTFESAESAHAHESSLVQAVVAGYAPIDFLQLDSDRPMAGSVSDDPDNVSLPPGMRSADPDSFESLLMGAPIETCPARVSQANPITYASPGAAPFLIVHGLSDTTVGVHQSELFYEALARHENDVTLCLIEGLGHGFLNRTQLDDGPKRRMTIRTRQDGHDRVEQVAQPIFPMIEAFFRKHLGGSPSRSPFSMRATRGSSDKL
jgi:acetyl esterase/lipase